MPSLMTRSLKYQLSVTPELRRHLRPFNNNNSNCNKIVEFVRGEQEKEREENINDIYELKQQQQQKPEQKQQQQQNSQKVCLQKILKKSQQHKNRRWILSCNSKTILKQIKLTNPTFDIQQQQQQLQQKQQQLHCQKHQQNQPQQELQQHLLKI